MTGVVFRQFLMILISNNVIIIVSCYLQKHQKYL